MPHEGKLPSFTLSSRARAIGMGGINAYHLDDDTLEFLRAIDAHKQKTGKAYPSWREILAIIRDLGYEKRSSSDAGESKARPRHHFYSQL